eukprot:PhF_6_TR14883/c0_g1_i3/m.23192
MTAVTDSTYHGIPLTQHTLRKLLITLYHHSPSMEPQHTVLYSSSLHHTVLDDPKVLYPYFRGCVRHRDWERALTTFHTFDSFPGVIDVDNRRCIVDTCVRCGRWEEGFRIVSSSGTKSEWLVALQGLQCLAKGKQWSSAIWYYLRHQRHSTPALDYVAQACHRAERYDAVLRVVIHALKGKVPLHETSVRIGLHAAEEVGDWSTCLMLYRSLQQHKMGQEIGGDDVGVGGEVGLEPVLYEQTIRALCGGGKWELAMEVYKELVE